ncbi:tetratricopeptide repeat protein [Pseudomonas sp. zjy_8]
MILRVLVTWGLVLCAGVAGAEPNDKLKEAGDRGVALYKQRDWYDSQQYLRKAAEAGDREAQYYLGEALRLSKRFMTAEAQKWYEAAAEQGDIHAMLRLSSKRDLCGTLRTCSQDQDYWRQRARKEGLERAEKGDPQAMSEMYNVTGDPDWLKKAAEAGSPGGQYQLANYYKAGEGWFFLPGARETEVEKWYKAAAENGHALAMMQLFEMSATKGDFESAREWLKKAVETGIVDAVSTYGANLVHMPDQMGFPLDKVKGYAFLSLVAEIRHEGDDFERGLLKAIEPTMSPEQVAQAKTYAKEWMKAHPPLSYFDPRFGF